jgi:hypothetical protein
MFSEEPNRARAERNPCIRTVCRVAIRLRPVYEDRLRGDLVVGLNYSAVSEAKRVCILQIDRRILDASREVR